MPGTTDKVKGNLKEAAGKMTGDRRLSLKARPTKPRATPSRPVTT